MYIRSVAFGEAVGPETAPCRLRPPAQFPTDQDEKSSRTPSRIRHLLRCISYISYNKDSTMSNQSGPSHRSVASIRSPTTAQPGAPAAPHTPLRTISSTYGSPSALRAEEECVVLELGSRYLRAGFAGDALPKAVVDFGPEERRRAGDYRKWTVENDSVEESHVQLKGWGEAYELWKPDLRGLDLGLVGDKLDRAVREAFTKSVGGSRSRRRYL